MCEGASGSRALRHSSEYRNLSRPPERRSKQTITSSILRVDSAELISKVKLVSRLERQSA